MAEDHVFSTIDKIINNTHIMKSPKSISSYAAKSIYYFPVLCSNIINKENAFLITSTLESAYSTFVRACFSMVPAMKVKGDTLNVEEYLKIFHQNVGIQSGTEYYLGYQHEDATPYEIFVNDTLNEASLKTIYGNIKDTLRDTETPFNMRHSDVNDLNKLKSDTRITKDKAGNITEVNRINKFSSSWEKDEEKHNNIKPTIISVNCVFLIGKNEQPVEVKIPVGVKAILHAVNNNELNNHIIDSIANKGLFHNLIRYTTGEMLSLGDIIFGISKMKKTIANSKDSDVAKWASAIDHRKRLNKLSKAALHKKPYMPNVSVVVSMDDINDIARLTGYNLLTDTHRAVKFMQDNFLLSFVIADDADECIYILYDGHTAYEEYPYKYLKRENDRAADANLAIVKALALR